MAESAQVVMERWAKQMTASTGKMRDKVMALRDNPMLKAAAKKEAWLAGIQEAAADGRWEDGLRAVSFEEWKKKTAEIGSARMQAGVEAAKPKMVAFLSQLLPFTENVKAQVDQMPTTTLEERIQKSVATMRLMAGFRYRKSAR